MYIMTHMSLSIRQFQSTSPIFSTKQINKTKSIDETKLTSVLLREAGLQGSGFMDDPNAPAKQTLEKGNLLTVTVALTFPPTFSSPPGNVSVSSKLSGGRRLETN